MNYRVRLGVSPTRATAVVHSQLWVSVSPSASPSYMVCCLAAVFLSWPHPHSPLSLCRFLPIWLLWLTLSLIPWLLEFHAVWSSGTSSCLLILDWLLSSFWLCDKAKGFYLCLHLGQNSPKANYIITVTSGVCVCTIIVWGHLLSSWRTSFSITCKAHLLATNFLSFYLLMFSIQLHFQKTVLLHIEFLLDSFFFLLSITNILSKCLLASIVSDEKPGVNLFGTPLQIMSFFSSYFQDFLFVLDFSNFTMMCLFVDLSVFILLGVHWVSWMCRFILSIFQLLFL